MSYAEQRHSLISNPQQILALEEYYQKLIVDFLRKKLQFITDDFNASNDLIDYWIRYAPKPRGRTPKLDSFPWGEVGEKVLEAFLYGFASSLTSRFLGLPYGHDVRFVTDDAFVHIDIKSSGPRDVDDEIVASPNQVSGDGIRMEADGFSNTPVQIKGPKSSSKIFQPELPPFYLHLGKTLPTLTYFLKCIYSVNPQTRHQPLKYLELVCVPNGLILFDGLNYAKSTTGLLRPGKDDQNSKHPRARIKLLPLKTLGCWRVERI